MYKISLFFLAFVIQTKQVYLARLKSFVNAHAKDLNRMGWNIEYLISQFEKELSEGEYTSDIMAQFMYITGFLDDCFDDTHYARHIENMNGKLDLDGKNILEVGAGVIPVVSIELAKRYSSSNLRSYDPDLLQGFIDLPTNVELHAEPIVYNKKGKK